MNRVNLSKKKSNALVNVVRRRLVPGPLRSQQGLFRFTEGQSYLAALGTRSYSLRKEMLIQQAELSLGLRFASSYRWFLKNFGGGVLDGAPIFSLTPALFEGPEIRIEASLDRYQAFDLEHDLVYQYLLDLIQGLPSEHLTFYRDGSGRRFYFDSAQPHFGEYPIYVVDWESHQKYAGNFYEFLYKQMQSLS